MRRSCARGFRFLLVLAVAGVLSVQPAAAGTPAVESRSPLTGQLSVECPAPADPVALSSVAQVGQLLVGTWIRCGEVSVLGPLLPGEVGIEIVADGRFFRVYEAPDGSLVRAQGLDQEGVWTVIDTTAMNGPGSYQLNLRLVGHGTALLRPAVFATPPTVRFPDVGAGIDHVRWTGPAPVPGTPAGVGTGACGQPVDPVTLTSVAQVEQLLIGTWERCGATSVFGTVQPGEVGVEFTADGRFSRLYRAADGSLVRGAGAGEEGTWTVEDLTAMNGPGFYGLSLQRLAGGSWPAGPVFLATPPFVRFVGYPANTSDYLRSTEVAPAPPPQVLPETGTAPVVPMLGGVGLLAIGVLVARRARPPAQA